MVRALAALNWPMACPAWLPSIMVVAASSPCRVMLRLRLMAPVYTPAAMRMVSPAVAWLWAYWMVAQGVALLVQSPLSLPVGATWRVAVGAAVAISNPNGKKEDKAISKKTVIVRDMETSGGVRSEK